ncbi:MAG: hypothetical protein A2283_08365 [Lentisphaerae bacterium RIFOXYA12_FULL_48_11]|nr:MAG: hypothetical protein A2283_08365 [Lentisphaerae bacterium RIFOXYA12_FULL_48_11]
MIKKQFTLYLENKPGELSRVAKSLAAGKVNIEGISVSAGADVALVQLIADNALATKKCLVKIDVPYTVQDVAVVPLRNDPGSLELVVSKLADAGVNIDYVYATTSVSRGYECYVVISARNLSKVEAVCRKCIKK